jgi:glycosyltransferase involved in cell wall biosynthesis
MLNSTRLPQYVLITPARNEAHFLAGVIEAVAAQTIRPARWVIVDDRSTDGTNELIRQYADQHTFIRILTITGDTVRHFGKKAAAFNSGLELLADIGYDYIGNLDADTILPPEYYMTLLGEFQKNPRLGIAGGAVYIRCGDREIPLDAAPDSVPGSVQLFRKACFESIGSAYLALPWGGIDAAAEITARMNGWLVQQFPIVVAHEQRIQGTAANSILGAKFKEGVRFHSLGYRTSFYLIRALYKMQYRPWIIGSVVALAGFLFARLRDHPVTLDQTVVTHLREEQKRKLLFWATGTRSSS